MSSVDDVIVNEGVVVARCTGYERRDGSIGHGGFCAVHGGWHCPLCGELEDGHDEAACDRKLAAWKPLGFLSEAGQAWWRETQRGDTA